MPDQTGSQLSGTIAASVTPLRDGGEAVDVEAIEALVAELARGGVDGILALGTSSAPSSGVQSPKPSSGRAPDG